MNEAANHDSRGGAESAESLDEITGAIIDSAMRIHSELGPGLLESVYEAVLSADLVRKGCCVERQKPFLSSSMECDLTKACGSTC